MRAQIDLLMRRKNWRPSTEKGYRYDLHRFRRWLENRDLFWRDVEESDVFDYLDDHPDWSPSSQHNAMAAIKAFYRHFVGRENSPAERISISRPDPGPQRTLSREEVDQVLGSFDTSKLLDIRNLALFTTALDTGARATELCRMRIPDLDLDKGQITVEVKGGRVARKLFGAFTGHCLLEWLAVRMASSTIDNVFVSIGGSKPGTPFTHNTLRIVFYAMAEKAGVRRFSPHAMRRTGATELLRAGASTRATQLWGDWESMDMPERYSQLLEKDTVRGKLPVDRFMGLSLGQDESERNQ